MSIKASTRFFSQQKNKAVQSAASSSTISTAIISSSINGGAGIAAKRLHKGLSQVGVKSKVFSLSQSRDKGFIQVQVNQSMNALLSSLQPFMADENRKAGFTILSASYPGLSTEQLSFLNDSDVVNIHWIQKILSNEAIAFLSHLGKPVVWTMHDMNPFTGACHYSAGCEKYQVDCKDCPQLKDSFDNFTQKVLQVKKRYWSDSIVLVSPSRWLAECAQKSAVFKNNRVEVIPNGIDTEVFKPTSKKDARSQLKLPQSCKILLFTCHSHKERRKGFRELLMTAKLLRSHAQPYHIVTFGKESSELSGLGLPYTSLGYTREEKILALGYSAADVTVLPTLEDNLPNTILESVSCGTPVVAFNSGGVGDAIADGVNGYLVQSGECEDLAEAIRLAIGEDLRNSCRRYALDEFTLEKQAHRYKELFQVLLENPPTAKPVNVPEIFQETAPVLAKMLAAKLASTQSEVQRQIHLNKQLQNKMEKMKFASSREMEKLNKLSNTLERITNSISWRITRPLRAIRHFVLDNKKFRKLLRSKR